LKTSTLRGAQIIMKKVLIYDAKEFKTI